ncbi:MAG TPA: hypothetical protein VM577_00190 [Anaerovoracaceae bacterium]|nr:hypothetical protein [Anaerovoracaceae bacterium]
MNFCKTCVHWQPYRGIDRSEAPFGECKNFEKLLEKLTPNVDGYDGEIDEFSPDADFGCVLHEDVTTCSDSSNG